MGEKSDSLNENCDSWASVDFGQGTVQLLCTRRKGHEGHHNTHVVWTDENKPKLRD